MRNKISYIQKCTLIALSLCFFTNLIKAQSDRQPSTYVDFFMGVDFNYQDLNFNGRVYDILLNLTPGIKWHMGKGWQSSVQVLVPIVNQ